MNDYPTKSVDEIIATTQVTKGAFCYQFKTKDEMGLTIIIKLLKQAFKYTFINPIHHSEIQLYIIYYLMYNLFTKNENLKVENDYTASNYIQKMTH